MAYLTLTDSYFGTNCYDVEFVAVDPWRVSKVETGVIFPDSPDGPLRIFAKVIYADNKGRHPAAWFNYHPDTDELWFVLKEGSIQKDQVRLAMGFDSVLPAVKEAMARLATEAIKPPA